MKLINLGKTLFLLAITPVFAGSNAVVNKTQFYPGDVITLTINAIGNQVQFPVISAIEGYGIIGNSSSHAIKSINGKTHQTSSQSYSFKPTKSLTIRAFNLQIDGKNERTNPITLSLLKPNQNKAGDDFILSIKADKTEFFLGEKVNLQVIFKQKKSANFNGRIEIEQPKIKGLSFKTNGGFVKSSDAHYNIATQNHQVTAHQAGVFNLPSIVAVIYANGNNFFGLSQKVERQKAYSNSIQFSVKPLPDNLEIYGRFKIKTSIDNSQIKAGEALNLALKITGDGNLDDIEKFALNLENATIYSDEPKVKNQQWMQKFAIVAQEDFVIPAFSLDFFDKHTQSKKTIATQPIKIQVLANQVPHSLSASSILPSKANNLEYYYLLSGVLIGMLIVGLVFALKRINRVHKNQSLIKQIKSTKGDKQLFDLLLPLNIATLGAVLQQLEGNLYKNQNHKISKKAIIKTIQGK